MLSQVDGRVIGMVFLPSTSANAADVPVAGCGAAVCVPDVAEDQLSPQELKSRLAEIRRCEAKLSAMKSKALAAYAQLCGEGMARQAAVDELQASRSQARTELQGAERLIQAKETSEALAAGQIPVGHARLLAKAVSDGPVDETLMVKAAETQTYGDFSRTLRDHQREQAGDDGQSHLDRQRHQRNFGIRQGGDGMYEVFGRFDPLAGNRIEAALADKERSLRSGSDKDERTLGQRLADAVEELICAEPEGRRPQGTTLILTANWDHVAQQLDTAFLLDGTPLPGREALRLACDANILPAIFDTDSQPLHLGLKRRSASEAQRAALIMRDKNCIGCGKSAVWCEAHHIVPWQDGGTTDIDNLVLVCIACHHDIHDRNWQVWKNPDSGQCKLKPVLNLDPLCEPPKFRSAGPDQDRPRTRGQAERHAGPWKSGPVAEPFPDRRRTRVQAEPVAGLPESRPLAELFPDRRRTRGQAESVAGLPVTQQAPVEQPPLPILQDGGQQKMPTAAGQSIAG